MNMFGRNTGSVDPYIGAIRSAVNFIPNMTLKEYFEIYQPEANSNNCCFQCKNSAGGCLWSSVGELPENAIAFISEEEQQTSIRKYTKILYCPEYEKGSTTKGKELNPDGCFNLLLAIARDTGELYRASLKTIMECRNEIKNHSSTSKTYRRYKEALSNIIQISNIFDEDKCRKLKRMVGFEEDCKLDEMIRTLEIEE